MMSQEIAEGSLGLEARVTTLETELAQMKQLLSKTLGKQSPWWLNVAGSFQNDPTFDEAIRCGQEWRQEAE
ncbi:MAG: hypothetical protein AB4352_22195 [Hormoscilla sp.]